ncbi:hypothetical protein MA9V1_139 [Chryseobacterium phage MA9V-1]|nr:hypothetical protein MA9V1_139 [Chryseobacterium phage MA9V-1]
MSKDLLNPAEYVAGLQGIKAQTLTGTNFVNEAISQITMNPFSHNMAANIVNTAGQIQDQNVQKWANDVYSRIDENIMTFSIGLLCESTQYSTAVFAGFKSVAGEILQMAEADIVRQIAVNGAFDKYALIPEVKQLILKAKNITLAKSGVTNQVLTVDDKYALKPMLAIISQIAATTFVVGFDGNVNILHNSANKRVALASSADIMASVDTENFMFDGGEFAGRVSALKTFENYYDSDMQSFVFNILGNKILWRLSDGYLFLNGEDSTFEAIVRVLQAKATALSLKQSAYTNPSHSATDDQLLEAFHILWNGRDNLIIFDAMIAVPNKDGGIVYTLCAKNTDVTTVRPNVYTCITKFPGSTQPFTTVYDRFYDYAKQFNNQFVVATLQKIFCDEIAAEDAMAALITVSNQTVNDNIARLVQTRTDLENAKVNLPAASLAGVNAQIISIDDMIAQQQSKIQQF